MLRVAIIIMCGWWAQKRITKGTYIFNFVELYCGEAISFAFCIILVQLSTNLFWEHTNLNVISLNYLRGKLILLFSLKNSLEIDRIYNYK